MGTATGSSLPHGLSWRELIRLIRVSGRRHAALAAIVALVLAVAACGDGDGGDGSAKPVRAAAQSDEEQISAVFEQMRHAMLVAPDADAACRLMAAPAREEFAAFAGPNGTCERGFTKYFGTGTTSEDPNPKLAGVRVDGDEAVVTARAKTSKGLQRASFVKEDGEWRVAEWLRD